MLLDLIVFGKCYTHQYHTRLGLKMVAGESSFFVKKFLFEPFGQSLVEVIVGSSLRWSDR